MEEQRKREVLEEIRTIYNSRGMSGLQRHVNNYSGDNGEAQYVENILLFLSKQNQKPATRIWAIDEFLVQELLDFD